MRNYNFCNNCGKIGHLFHQCKIPITSIGIIAFRIKNNKIEYLLIRRKDSLSFVDFLRGKYQLNNKNYILNLISRMTNEEWVKLLNNDFNDLWNYLWGDSVGIQYRSEEKISCEKMRSLKVGVYNKTNYTLDSLIQECQNSNEEIYEDPEWGFPKGRRNYQEKDLTCALREFEEETGYSKNNLYIIQNLLPFEEIFTGSNYKSYKHKYFLAYVDNNIKSIRNFQKSEVSKVEWKDYESTVKLIRNYNLEKKDLIRQVNKLLSTYTLYL